MTVLHDGEIMTHQTQDITFKHLFSCNFMEYITGRHISFSAKHSELLLGLPYLGANLELMALLKGVDPCFVSLFVGSSPFLFYCVSGQYNICVVCTGDIVVVG